jgi:serine/threonine protein kinase
MQNYQKEALLGEGMFGVVYRARDKRTDVAVALKKSESHSLSLTSLTLTLSHHSHSLTHSPIQVRTGESRTSTGVHFTALREIKFLGELRHDNSSESTRRHAVVP